MTKRPKTKVPTSPSAIAAELASIGHPISRRQVAKDIANGADLSSTENYLAWRLANEQRTPRKLPGNPTLAELRSQKLVEEIAFLKVRRKREESELAKARGELVEISKVHESQDRCCAKAVAVLTQKFETELPPKLDGCPAADIAAANMKALDEVRLILSNKETYA